MCLSTGGGVSAPQGCLLRGAACSRGVPTPRDVCFGGSAPGGVCSGGYLLWGCLLQGGVCSGGVCLLWGCVCSGRCLLRTEAAPAPERWLPLWTVRILLKCILVHNAIMFIDTSNNAWYNQVHWLFGMPYLSIIATKDERNFHHSFQNATLGWAENVASGYSMINMINSKNKALFYTCFIFRSVMICRFYLTGLIFLWCKLTESTSFLNL